MGKYEKSDIDSLLQVSATTFAILISLGLALPQVFSSENLAKTMTSHLWHLGVLLNLAALMIPILFYMSKNQDDPHELATQISYVILFVAYILIFVAVYLLNQAV